MYKKNYFNFKKWKNQYLLTNDLGNFVFLSQRHFHAFIQNKKLPTKVKQQLENAQFLYEETNDEFVKLHAEKLQEYKGYLAEQTVLHIFVVSKNCNYSCVYCQAGNLNQNEEFLMDEKTAQKAVEIAFESPSHMLTFEFQGGEPLTNFKIIQFIIEYAKRKNESLEESKRKEIEFSIVTNLSLLTDEMTKFILKHHVSICTSLDGPMQLQRSNRPCASLNSYEATVNNLKKLQERGVKVSALLTTTKQSLEEAKAIVDEYVKLGLDRIVVRPLTKLGKASEHWNDIGYTAEEFVKFYREVLKYILKKNQQGYFLTEGMTSILLAKILRADGGNYMELRSPCGGAIGQLAYYYDGNIYTCDEGRMLAEMGDKTFLLGNVFESHYHDLMQHDCTKKVCQASCLECLTPCHSCVYMPYCGTCPVLNYANTGDFELKHKSDFKCQVMTGMLDTIFDDIHHEKEAFKIFNNWMK